MKKENRITKTQRIKINFIESPTTDWTEFDNIFNLLQKETITASNKIISIFNAYNAFGKEEGDKWIEQKYNSKIRNAAYKVAREHCLLQYSGSACMVSDHLYKTYFSGQNSWKKKIEKGEGNPPMTFTDKIPLKVRGDHTKIECIDKTKGYYLFTSSFLSPYAKDNMEYIQKYQDEEENWKRKKVKININSTRLSFRFTVKRNANLEKLIDKLMDDSSGYKIGDSQLTRKKNKKTKLWEYYFMLSYSYGVKDPIRELLPDRVMGIDLGIKVPIYATINDKSWLKLKYGNNRIHKKYNKYIFRYI